MRILAFLCHKACQGFRMVAGAGMFGLCLAAAPPVQAQQAPAPTPPPENTHTPLGYHPGQKSGLPYDLGFQVTLIDQQLFKFRSPYEGPHSLLSRNENEKTDT